jgi:chromosome segregation ATPase
MEKRNKKKNKNNQEEETKDVDYSKLKDEIDSFLKVNEEVSKAKGKEEEQIKKIKSQAVEKLKDLKVLKEEKNHDEIYNIAVESVKSQANTEVTNYSNKIKLDQLNKEVTMQSDSIAVLNSKVNSSEKYSKMLLEKCNQLNEEKKKLIIEETEKRNELIKRCEDFMKDMQSKFEKEIPEKEMLIKENDDLRKKLQETKCIIEEKLDFAQKSKDMFEENIKLGMESKLKELIEKESLHQAENIQLKAQLNLYNQKFDELTKSIQTYSSHYDTLKKEIDKVSYYFVNYYLEECRKRYVK